MQRTYAARDIAAREARQAGRRDYRAPTLAKGPSLTAVTAITIVSGSSDGA